MVREWTEIEDSLLMDLYDAFPIKDIVIPFRTQGAIFGRIQSLKTKGVIFSYSKDEITDIHRLVVKLRYDGYTISQIGEAIGYSNMTVSSILKRYHAVDETYMMNRGSLEKIQQFMQEKKSMPLWELQKHYSTVLISKAFYNRIITKVSFTSRRNASRVFKPEFIHSTYVCIDNLAIIELFSRALIPSKDMRNKSLMTMFMRSYLSDTEITYVFEKCGMTRHVEYPRFKSKVTIEMAKPVEEKTEFDFVI